MQFGFPWIMGFTLACGVLFSALAAAGEAWLFAVCVSAAVFILVLGGIGLRILLVERDRTMEMRRRLKSLSDQADRDLAPVETVHPVNF